MQYTSLSIRELVLIMQRSVEFPFHAVPCNTHFNNLEYYINGYELSSSP